MHSTVGSDEFGSSNSTKSTAKPIANNSNSKTTAIAQPEQFRIILGDLSIFGNVHPWIIIGILTSILVVVTMQNIAVCLRCRALRGDLRRLKKKEIPTLVQDQEDLGKSTIYQATVPQPAGPVPPVASKAHLLRNDPGGVELMDPAAALAGMSVENCETSVLQKTKGAETALLAKTPRTN